jgi:hypothetical protein
LSLASVQTSAKSKAGVKGKPAPSREPDHVQERFDAVFGGPVTVPRTGIAFRQLLFHGKSSEHLWCRVCTRAFPNGTYRQVGEVRRCPYSDCNGHATVDAMEWARVQGNNADYPQVPLLGTAYPMGPVAPLRRASVP